jgi:hypothetical protein
VLHLVADIPRTLAEVARVLRPRGTLVATGLSGSWGRATSPRSSAACRSDSATPAGDDDPDLIIRLAADAGFELVARIDEPGRPVSPRAEADLIEARSQAWTWSIDDETWAGVVEPALARIRALPDQDPRTPRSRPHHPRLPPLLTHRAQLPIGVCPGASTSLPHQTVQRRSPATTNPTCTAGAARPGPLTFQARPHPSHS